MIWSVYMFIAFFVSVCTLLVFSPFLSLRRDFFFFVLYLQVVIYLNLAPAIASFDLNEKLKIQYILVMLACLILFEIPLLIFYTRSFKKRGQKVRVSLKWFQISLRKQLLFSTLITILTASFLYVVIKNGLLYRRLGIGTPIRLINLTLVEHVVFRLFTESGIFLTCILLLIFLACPKRTAKRPIAFVTLLVNGSVYAVYALINSRLESLMLFFFIAGVILRQSGDRVFSNKKLIALSIGLILSLFYVLRISENIRFNYPREGLRVEHFNLFYRSYNRPFDVYLPQRLNGLDLMARITPSAIDDMFARGTAWKYPVVATFGSLFDKNYINNLKLEMMTTSKRALMRKYTSIDLPDYPSCMLMDAYGNFGPIGLLAVAFVLGILCRIGVNWFSEPRSAVSIIIGLFLLSYILQFEMSFISLFLDWTKTLPVLIIVLLFNPLHIKASPKLSTEHEK